MSVVVFKFRKCFLRCVPFFLGDESNTVFGDPFRTLLRLLGEALEGANKCAANLLGWCRYASCHCTPVVHGECGSDGAPSLFPELFIISLLSSLLVPSWSTAGSTRATMWDVSG